MMSSVAVQLCRQCRQQFISLPLRCPRAVVRRPSQADVELRSWLLKTPARCAGHSHWQNVKKVKTEKDEQRQKMINVILHRIRTAVRGRYYVYLMYLVKTFSDIHLAVSLKAIMHLF